MPKPHTIPRREATTIRMIEGNERRFTHVIDGDDLKLWVGFGWVTLRKATDVDRWNYPTLESA